MGFEANKNYLSIENIVTWNPYNGNTLRFEENSSFILLYPLDFYDCIEHIDMLITFCAN
jgi:hypothetical protein